MAKIDKKKRGNFEIHPGKKVRDPEGYVCITEYGRTICTVSIPHGDVPDRYSLLTLCPTSPRPLIFLDFHFKLIT